MRKIPEVINESELQKLIKVADLRKAAALKLGFYQCMRISEIVNLQPEDITYSEGRETWLHIKQGKGKKDRQIPIVKETGLITPNVPLPFGIRAFQIWLKKASLNVLGRSITPHTLRHSGATHYLNKKKVGLRHIQLFLGHSRLDTTQIYTHIKPEELKGAFS